MASSRTLSPCSAWNSFRRKTARWSCARLLERFLTQPFFTTEQFTGLTGKLVSLKDALDGCERILHDEFKDYPESSLYLLGPISEAKGKPKPIPPGAPAKPENKPGGLEDISRGSPAQPKRKSMPPCASDSTSNGGKQTDTFHSSPARKQDSRAPAWNIANLPKMNTSGNS